MCMHEMTPVIFWTKHQAVAIGCTLLACSMLHHEICVCWRLSGSQSLCVCMAPCSHMIALVTWLGRQTQRDVWRLNSRSQSCRRMLLHMCFRFNSLAVRQQPVIRTLVNDCRWPCHAAAPVIRRYVHPHRTQGLQLTVCSFSHGFGCILTCSIRSLHWPSHQCQHGLSTLKLMLSICCCLQH